MMESRKSRTNTRLRYFIFVDYVTGARRQYTSHAMKILSTLFLAVAASVTAATGFSAETIAWGHAANGLRLGIAVHRAPSGSDLRVQLENTSTAALDVLIGYRAGKGIAFSFRFFAKDRQGIEREGVEL